MEQLKDPATLLSIINSIGLAGSSFYFYKQNETFQLDLNKTDQAVKSCVTKTKELDKGQKEIIEGLRIVSKELKDLNDKVKDLPTYDNIRDLDQDLEEVIDVLHENHIEVIRPSQRFRSGDRRDNRNAIREIEQDRSFRPVQSSRRQEMSFRERRPHRDDHRTRDDDRQSKSDLSNRTQPIQDSKEDELDLLIGDVRKGQAGH